MTFPFYSEVGKKLTDVTKYCDELYSSFRTSANCQNISYLLGNAVLYLTLGSAMGLSKREYDNSTIFTTTVAGVSAYVALLFINNISAAYRDIREEEIMELVKNHPDYFTDTPFMNVPNNKLSIKGAISFFTKPNSNKPVIVPPIKPFAVSLDTEEKGQLLPQPPTSADVAKKVTSINNFLRR